MLFRSGILGPVLVNYIREFQISRGVAPADAYTATMYVLVGLLGLGFFCNLAVRPVSDRLQIAIEPTHKSVESVAHASVVVVPAATHNGLVATAWTLAAIPLFWGVSRTLTLASQMFR